MNGKRRRAQALVRTEPRVRTKVLLFGRVGKLEFPPAVVAPLNTAVTPHLTNAVHLPGLQIGHLVSLHLAQLLCVALTHTQTHTHTHRHTHDNHRGFYSTRIFNLGLIY